LPAGSFQQPFWAIYAVRLERQLAKVPDGIDHDLMGPLGCSTGDGVALHEVRPPLGRVINEWTG
jgi:aryl-alcohol dehydrogenase